MTQPDPQTPLSEYPDEMVDAIVEIGLALYMNGFSTGVATLAVNSGSSHADADKIASAMSEAVTSSPISLATTRKEVMDILNGIQDRKSYSVQVPRPTLVDDSL